jgi:hypothetical protein
LNNISSALLGKGVCRPCHSHHTRSCKCGQIFVVHIVHIVHGASLHSISPAWPHPPILLHPHTRLQGHTQGVLSVCVRGTAGRWRANPPRIGPAATPLRRNSAQGHPCKGLQQGMGQHGSGALTVQSATLSGPAGRPGRKGARNNLFGSVCCSHIFRSGARNNLAPPRANSNAMAATNMK